MEAVLGHPPAGMGQVVFFRPSSFMGVALVFHPREGETAYGSLASGRYFILNVTPGEHDFTVRSEVVNHLHVEAEEGETQYASLSLSMGIMAAHPNLQPSTAAAFQAALPHMRRGPDHEIPRPPSH